MRFHPFQSGWQVFRSSLRGFDSPRQLAMGCALGVWIGLLPKDSLFPWAIAVMAVLSTANLASLAVTAVGCHLISPLGDSLWASLGERVLTMEQLTPLWVILSDWPLMGWTRYSNTVVMGTFVTGLALLIPVYLISRLFFSRFGAGLRGWFQRQPVVRWITHGTETELGGIAGR